MTVILGTGILSGVLTTRQASLANMTAALTSARAAVTAFKPALSLQGIRATIVGGLIAPVAAAQAAPAPYTAPRDTDYESWQP